MFETFIAVAVLSLICFVGYKYGKQIGSRRGFAAGRFRFRRKRR